MNSSLPAPSPEILTLIQACGDHLRKLDSRTTLRAFDPPSADSADPGATPVQLETVYRTACGLCDEGNFRFAAALALHLVAFRPKNPRYGFLAGSCMQRLGLYSNAIQLFCFALVHGGDSPATLYRLAECLLAIGDRRNAERAMDAAMDLAREDADAGELMGKAHQFIESIRSRGRP